jgi:Fur family iron response transcriptional regulator
VDFLAGAAAARVALFDPRQRRQRISEIRSAGCEQQAGGMDVLPNLSTEELHGTQVEGACGEACPDCSAGDVQERLREAGLRPTRQRTVMGRLLFAGSHRHVTAESLHAEAAAAGMQLSLATVYNTLNQFTQAGLLRRVGPDGARCFFDTDTSAHPHFYLEGEDILIDVPERLTVQQMPKALPGHEISRLDIVIRIRRKAGNGAR